MAKKSMIEREKKRQHLVDVYSAKRASLKEIIANQDLPVGERFVAAQKLAQLPRNSSATRLHNRCQLTGRPHAYYRKLKLSRIMLRELASFGQIPGMVKSSW
ncbi:30S ribosomal protein S14 [Gemmobacter serpentinus]|uniref:30S ribosomal protein S14 n=1 Tax=Gemmobacter serpentinus TaxID=2652247 RepID=UPI00124E6B32|nr:30S ribosomal protein S14 [Gemmobacter serpentinus]